MDSEILCKFWIENGAKPTRIGDLEVSYNGGKSKIFVTGGPVDRRWISDPRQMSQVPLEVLVDLWQGKKDTAVDWKLWRQWYILSGAKLRLALCRALGLEA